jgi:hypothetical protein
VNLEKFERDASIYAFALLHLSLDAAISVHGGYSRMYDAEILSPYPRKWTRIVLDVQASGQSFDIGHCHFIGFFGTRP